MPRYAARDLRARAFTLALRLYADLSPSIRFLVPDEVEARVPSPYGKSRSLRRASPVALQ